MRKVSSISASALALASTFAVLAIFSAPTAFAQSQSTYLRWAPSLDAASNPSLTYNVYRASSCSGTFAKINAAPVTGTIYLDNQPPPGSYCYRVTAVLNGLESNPSNTATATILPSNLPPQTQQSGASTAPSSSAPPASAKSPCQHAGDLVTWIRCVASKARAKIAPPLPVR